MELSAGQKRAFQKTVWDYYKKHGRHTLPWRPPTLPPLRKASEGQRKLRKGKNVLNPYKIVVSEIMLQQTQVTRVLEKYPAFVRQFPSWQALARAPQSEVLRLWSGLGYNRRALHLHRLAKVVSEKYRGRLPRSFEILKTLPGIGPATAAAVRAFAWNEPTPFIETNIRAVFIRHFFTRARPKTAARHTNILQYVSVSCDGVCDRDILLLVAETMDGKNPREWFYALMDYGAYLKQKHRNPSRRSAHYAKQSRFEGSDRQIRGAVLRILLNSSPLAEKEITRRVSADKKRVLTQLRALEAEKFLRKSGNGAYTLAA
ncbi:MAG: A/G-specific adenine glycosylase [Parcubacteria group bacterium]|nr:A/G-specific adenine glycosylase [Parcubacteria group bacterium]